ncbi:MAG: PBP1A family penicillin-binding protein [Oscillospiraceae bacterium]|jgi:penicillin-binding protein 1A|nr:PBP1A family penicillin-binding protein [Oscillospiraceae bacterium]
MARKQWHGEKIYPHTLFKPRTRKPNFAISMLVACVRLVAVLLVVTMVAGGGVVLGIVKAYTETAPELDLAQIDDQAQTSFFYDAQGTLITDYKGSQDRVMVSIDEIPEMLQNAFIAVEDARFLTHNGVDAKRILGAFVSNLTSSSTQGGSTITQQLLKTTMLSSEQSYKRKIQEAYMAMQLEKIYSKDQILESYLNSIYLGESYYGVKTAAMGYFGKELADLTLRECAMLAGVARSPYYYNPRRNYYTRQTPEVADNRTDYALRQMYENELIPYDQYQAALSRGSATVLESAPNSSATLYDYPYYVEYAVEDVITAFLKLNSLEDTTANRSAMENKLRTGGYHVYLCIDTEIQQIVEQTLADWQNYPLMRDPSDATYRQSNSDGTFIELIQPQSAAVIIDYRTGELKAVVGGRTAPEARKTLNRATDMNMPVGSAIKPISVYAPAIELGQSPASIVYNMPVPIHGWNDGGGADYYPSNYGGGGFTGPTTLRRSLRQSYNTGAAQTLMYYVGVDRSTAFLQAMGVADKNINSNAFGLALGSSGITPVQMAAAFGTLGNEGIYQEPIAFYRIEDSDGNVIIDRRVTQLKRQVFSAGTAWLTIDMMKDAVESGTATKAKINGQTVAGKTGTNSDYRGVTYAGLTGWYSGSVWIGHDNYKPLSSKATGGDSAAPLWQAIMKNIHQAKGLQNRDIIEKEPEQVGLVRITTCQVSGLLATSACRNDMNGYGTVTDYWREGTEPAYTCNMHQELTLCAETGLLATEYCPNIQTESAVIIPIGHSLYDFIDSHGDAMRRYLGEFAGLKLTQDNDYNQRLVSNLTCTLHTSHWVEEVPQWGNDALISEAQTLAAQGMELLTNRGYELTGDEYVTVSYAIMNLNTMLDSGQYGGLAEAISTLRYALSVFN